MELQREETEMELQRGGGDGKFELEEAEVAT